MKSGRIEEGKWVVRKNNGEIGGTGGRHNRTEQIGLTKYAVIIINAIIRTIIVRIDDINAIMRHNLVRIDDVIGVVV